MTLDECLESCVRMKKCMAFTHLDTDNSCKLFNFFPDLGGEEKEIPCKGPCVTRYIGLPQFCYTISTDYPFYRQHVNRLDDCYTYGILCKNHYMLQDEVNRSRLELQRMKKENEVLFKLSPATLIEEENKSRQTTLIYFATQTVSEVETLKSLIEINIRNPVKDNDDLKSSANRMEKLIQISEKILTDTVIQSSSPTQQTGENQFEGYISSLTLEFTEILSEKMATIDKIEKLDGWRVSLVGVIDVLKEKPLLEWIDSDPETVLELLLGLKSSCQYYKTQT